MKDELFAELLESANAMVRAGRDTLAPQKRNRAPVGAPRGLEKRSRTAKIERAASEISPLNRNSTGYGSNYFYPCEIRNQLSYSTNSSSRPSELSSSVIGLPSVGITSSL